jgi:hypothetical protein
MTRVQVWYDRVPLKEVVCTTFLGVGRNTAVSFFNNSIHNLSQAVEARAFRRKVGGVWSYIDTTPHEIGLYYRFCGDSPYCDFEKRFDNFVVDIAPMTDIDFIQHYKGRRRIVYQNAYDSLQQEPLSLADANCKCFLKKEKDIPEDKDDAIPRVITFPDPRYGLCFGKYIKAIEHAFFDCIDGVFGSKTVMKGLNYSEVGKEVNRKWSRFIRPRSIDGDVSRLDSSISDEALRLYYHFARKFFDYNDSEDLRKLCDMQLGVEVTGRSKDGSLKYTSTGLGSGQMNTSQTGVFIVCYILYIFIKDLDLDLEVVNCGDDFTVIGEESDILKFQKYSIYHFLQFNMILKLEQVVEEIEGINFCQTHPVLINGEYRMCRDPFTALVKDSTSIDNLSSPALQGAFLKAISESGIATHGGMPIFQDVYMMFSRSSRYFCDRSKRRQRRAAKRFKLTNHSMLYWGKNLNCRYKQEIPDETRFSFYLAFGIDPTMQKYIESYYQDFVISSSHSRLDLGDKFDWNNIRL